MNSTKNKYYKKQTNKQTKNYYKEIAAEHYWKDKEAIKEK